MNAINWVVIVLVGLVLALAGFIGIHLLNGTCSLTGPKITSLPDLKITLTRESSLTPQRDADASPDRDPASVYYLTL